MVRDKMTPLQFYGEYIRGLPEQFHTKNRHVMSSENIRKAVKDMQNLCVNAKNAQRQGCEGVKNMFLGGMKDGESWGLRKWLSGNGGALMICNDAECILHAVQKLDRSDDATIKLAKRMRPLARSSLTRLTEDVPKSYQEQSTAHPFLPFFHRLESALRGISNFDPEDDDVICIDDDDEVEILKSAPPKPRPKKPAASTSTATTEVTIDDAGVFGVAVDEKIKDGTRNSSNPKPASQKPQTDPGSLDVGKLDVDLFNVGESDPGDGLMATVNDTDGDSEYMKALLRSLNDEPDDDDDVMNINFDEIDRRTSMLTGTETEGIFDLSLSLDRIAYYFESHQRDLVRPPLSQVSADDFLDLEGPYAGVLRLFSTLLKEQDAVDLLVDPINVQLLDQDLEKPSYMSIIRHPICFRDIVTALVVHFDSVEMTVVGNSGSLETKSLSNWNMWRGNDILMAVDLVFLNTLAYAKAIEGSKTETRSRINKMRKMLWTGIKDIIERLSPSSDEEAKKRLNPTRRSESSGFVVHKLAKAKDE